MNSFYRRFETRRIVITSNELLIALVNDEVIRERIPLLEIISVEEQGRKDESPAAEPNASTPALARSRTMSGTSFKANGRADSADDSGMSTSFTTTRHADSIRIITKEGGYNAGRSYFLQASSRAMRMQIMGLLNKYISHTRRDAEVRSKFKQSQDSVKHVINSSAFQFTSSLLIVAVTSQSPNQPHSMQALQMRGDSYHSPVPGRALITGVPIQPADPTVHACRLRGRVG